MHKTFGFFIVMLGLAILLAFLYVGLNMAEQGIQDLVGLNQVNQALCFSTGDDGLIITFAGRDYVLPWKDYRERLMDIISTVQESGISIRKPE